jgi:hypothetical protein
VTVLAALSLCAVVSAQGAWLCYGGSPQHRSLAPAKAQPLNRVLWSTPVDLSPSYETGGTLTAHYGSPLVTRANTVILPIKTGTYDGFKIEARNGATGALIYSMPTDYSTVSAAGWISSFGPALGRDGKLFWPGSGGTVFVKKDADKAGEGPVRSVFYGGDGYTAARELYDANVKICTPLTVDAKGNAWFGFRTLGGAPDETPIGPAGLLSGIARVDWNGKGAWRSVKVITGDADAMRIQFQCAPALNDDENTVYFSVQLRNGGGYLVGIDPVTMETKYRTRLIDPASGNDAILGGQSTASPTIGLDGDVFFGVLSNPEEAHNKRGYLLHFDKTLTTSKVAGSFGWDTTASLIPTSALPGYKGKSSYFVITKYNNYALFGDGVNRVALLDPFSSMSDPLAEVGVMNEVETIPGPSSDPKWAGPDYPGAVYEWCTNAAAVDPLGKSVLVNSEDGRLYRWDLMSNRITEGVLLDGPRGQAYTPTVVGPTGIVYAINNARLFAVGK